MRDVYCRVCGEPWGYHGIRHGDMSRWEAKLLLAGAGCPGCEGVSPFADDTDLERLADPSAEQGLTDQHTRSLYRVGLEPNENRVFPSWEKPLSEPLWTCQGCEVEVVQDIDSDFPDGDLDGRPNGTLMWSGGRRYHYYAGAGYSYGEMAERPVAQPHVMVGEDAYCKGCVKMCPDCGDVPLAANSEMEEAFPSFLVDDDDMHRCRAVCEDCYREWRDEQERDFDEDEEDFSSDWEE